MKTPLFGALDAPTVFTARYAKDDPGAWKAGNRGIYVLDEAQWYRLEETVPNAALPTRLYVCRGIVPLRTIPQGDVPDLGAFDVPPELAEKADAERGPAVLKWIQEVLDASAPRLRIMEAGKFVSPRSFTLEPSGQWTVTGRESRSGHLDEAERKAIFDLVDSEQFRALPLRIGHDRSPCLDWVSFELRTRSGVHEVMLFDVIETGEEREADSYCRRIFDALPIDSSIWKLR